MPPNLTLPALRAAYAAGELTPSQLIDEVLRRNEAYADPALWIHLRSRADLLAAARRLEERGSAGLPLYGVPFAIKDNIDLAGVPTTAACPEFAYTPAESSPVVQRLIDAGAIPLGKVNLDQFATGLVGVRSPYGTPRNPHRADVIPGGSSSGSAVAVAAKLVTFSLGTDTAGSGRIPAGLNNLIGLKPTRGALSTRGVVPACRSLDCVSIFALTCADAAEIGDLAEAYDAADPFSRRRPKPAWALSALPRIGVPRPDQLTFCGDAAAEADFRRVREQLTQAGANMVEIDFAPFQQTAALLYQGPWIAERWAALRSFHRAHADAFFPLTRTIIEGGARPDAADAFEGTYRLAELRRKTEAVWDRIDVLLVPTAPRPYTLAEVAAEPLACNSQLGTYTNFVNLLDLTALATPAGVRADAIPWGVTWIAPAWAEPTLLECGRRWEAVQAGAGWSPAGTAHRQQSVRLAVVGAHLTGQPLNHQLTDRGARCVWSGRTEAAYRLYALQGTRPAKPGLRRVTAGGAAIALEVWELTPAAFGEFVAAVPPPLCIGTVALENGETVKGFLCEPHGLDDAEDITAYGGWRAYLGRDRR